MARRPSPSPRYLFRKDFSGGQNDTVTEINIAQNEAALIRNIDIERDGAITKRLGATLMNDVTTLDGEVGMIFQFHAAGQSAELLVANDDKIQSWDGANAFTPLVTGLTADQIVLPVPFRQLLFLMNNADNPAVYWPGAGGAPKIYRPLAPAPDASSMALAQAAGGGLADGLYYVRVRFVDRFGDIHFGEPDDDLKNITIAGGVGVASISVTAIPTGVQYSGVGDPDFYVAKRIMERTLVGGSKNGPYYQDGIINDNTTTTYSFTQTDVQLLELELSPDVGRRLPMPALWPYTYHKQRIVGVDPTDLGKVVWSEIDEFGIIPGAVPDVNFVYLDIDDQGDRPQAVAKLGEYLVFYCGRSVHEVYIDAAGEGYTRRMSGHRLGFPSPRCVVELPAGHIVWSFKGPYLFDGENFVFIGERIEGSIKDSPKGNLDHLYALHRSQEQRRQVKFVMPESGATNNFAAKYHYRRASLAPTGFPTQHAFVFDDGFTAKSGVIIQDTATAEEIEYEGTYDGKIYKADFGDHNGHHANGLIDARYKTGWESDGTPHLVKVWEEIWVFIRGEVPEDIMVSWETEFSQGVSGAGVLDVAETEAAVFDIAQFDQAVFAVGGAQILHAALAESGVFATGKFLQLTFQNNAANAPFTLMGYVIKYHYEFDRDEQE